MSFIKTFLKNLGYVTTYLLVILIAGALAIRLLSPLANHFTPIENWVSNKLHQPVTIQAVHTRWQAWHPAVQFEAVKIYSAPPEHKLLLPIENVQISVNLAQSVLHWRWVPSQIKLVGAHIVVHPLGNRRYDLNGLSIVLPDFSAPVVAQNNPLAALLSSQFMLQKIDVEWHGTTTPTPFLLHIDRTRIKLKPNNVIIRGRNLTLLSSAFFNTPPLLQSYSGQIFWVKDTLGLHIAAKDWQLKNPNWQLQGSTTLFLPNAATGPEIDTRIHVIEKNIAELKNYVPEKILAPTLAAWLKQAFVKGQGFEGDIILQGPLRHFPFDDDSGKFAATLTLAPLDFRFNPHWPMLTDLAAQILVQNKNMKILVANSKIEGVETHAVQAEIANLAAPELKVHSNFAFDAHQAIAFIQNSPLQNRFGKALTHVDFYGPMQLELTMQIPLHRSADGASALAKPGAKADAPSALRGDLTLLPYNKITLPQGEEILSNLAGNLQFTANSVTSTDLKAIWLKQPVAMQISTTKNAANDNVVNIDMDSKANLADLQKAYHLDFIKSYASGESNFHSQIAITKNKHQQQKTVFSVDSDLAGIAVHLPAPLKKTSAEKTPLHVALEFSDQDTLANIAGKYSDIQFQAAPQQNAWQLNLNSPAIAGQCSIPKKGSQAPLQGEFQRFHLDPTTTSTITKINPQDIPALRMQLHNFSYGDKNFGDAFLLTYPKPNSMQIQKLNLLSQGSVLTASGQWQQLKNGSQLTQFNGTLASTDLGATLKSWSITRSLVKGDGELNFNAAWPGVAYHPEFGKLTGDFALKFASGRIINISEGKEAEMGLGRILNLLSLQSIPRRLTLDFSDLVQKGFSFDKMQGNFQLKNGNAFTQDAYMKGPVAKIAIKGRIGLGAKDYDLTMITTPYVTSSFPAIATLAGGPIAGAATWVASKMLSSVVNKITSSTYTITGPWDQPQIIKLSEFRRNQERAASLRESELAASDN